MSTKHFDTLIVGAGLSGINAAYRLQTQRPDKSYAIIEGRAAMGGTWDLFRYPGVRSDSDMFTLGYPFHPWKDAKAIADGSAIRDYIRDTANTHGIDDHVLYEHRVTGASWSSDDGQWTVEIDAAGSPETFTCNFLYLCTGYYSYEGGFAPTFPGLDSFAGEVVHPQEWPEDLDYEGKRVVIIGSGATAMTLLPAMADRVEHITMLQRSPSYVMSLPAHDKIADIVRKVLPEKLAHTILRAKNIVVFQAAYQLCRRAPKFASRVLLAGVHKKVGDQVPIDPHFTPSYKPWDQRLCLVPDGDLYGALNSGKASVVTDRIATFDEKGITLESGTHLDADIVVTATGLKIVAAGEIPLTVDGISVEPGQSFTYKGLMMSGVPNFGWCVGYTNASWTLRSDLAAEYVCRFLDHLDSNGHDFGTPVNDEQLNGQERPLIDLNSGYLRRAMEHLPKQGSTTPWQLRTNYFLDSATMRRSDVTEHMRFGKKTPPRSSIEKSLPRVNAAATAATN
ncbi:NAD(P)/FAD-dependent oxidoreductase [Rhodococcus sp. H29-C3]|uniref:flavin-containing monooxygenase n=1 Tax=Rhodococcus sp. H29-C3 TaxID=3046307 RepID=UPI0024BB010B|nr:NAD(P)/FAD-dependent oxidoreductase [Rhodococcus sp. H29-C3]MDJ0359039.1 NAD(P)/FAD-dependent oxidoreductase [Rhodococcus sp. H29-C3]